MAGCRGRECPDYTAIIYHWIFLLYGALFTLILVVFTVLVVQPSVKKKPRTSRFYVKKQKMNKVTVPDTSWMERGTTVISRSHEGTLPGNIVLNSNFEKHD